jgi:hypothetical protein
MIAMGGRGTRMKDYDFKVLRAPDETGGYVATGCYSQGDTVDRAQDRSVKPSSFAWRTLQAHGDIIPDPSRVLVGSVAVTR